MSVIYRIVQADDTVACVKILRDWVDETPWMPESPYSKQSMEVFWREVIEEDAAWIACVGGSIIGFCVRNDENIGALYVVPELRDFSIGKQLLDMAKVNCNEVVAWAFEPNERIRKFYNREGFVEANREIDDETDPVNIEHRWMPPLTN